MAGESPRRPGSGDRFLDRRQVLLASGTALVLAACGAGNGAGSAGSSPGSSALSASPPGSPPTNIFLAMNGQETVPTVLAQNGTAVPTNYRSYAGSIGKVPAGVATDGMGALRVSGSATFTPGQLPALVQAVGTSAILVLDLQAESHGYSDQDAIAWYGPPKNQSNKGLSGDQVVAREQALLQSLLAQPTNPFNVPPNGPTIAIPSTGVMTQQTMIQNAGYDYDRIFWTDSEPLKDQHAATLIGDYQGLSTGQWLHVHCQAGDHRTSQALMVIDMLMNAALVSYADINARSVAVGNVDLDDAKDGPAMQRFYEWAADNPGGSPDSWLTYASVTPMPAPPATGTSTPPTTG